MDQKPEDTEEAEEVGKNTKSTRKCGNEYGHHRPGDT